MELLTAILLKTWLNLTVESITNKLQIFCKIFRYDFALFYTLYPSNQLNISNLIYHIIQTYQTNPGRQLTLMYLLEAGILDTVNIDAQLESANCQKMSSMASFFANVATDLQEAFFLFRNFTRILDNRNKGESLI